MAFESFPRYEQFDPMVPVWSLTEGEAGCFHRFFDTSPISPSGRYLAVLQMPQERRQPTPGEVAKVRLVDLETGENRVVAETRGWEPQMGANINWGSSDSELFFNDVDTDSWQAFAWKLNPLDGSRQKMDSTVYHCSGDGKWLISANMLTMRHTQPGYGVQVPSEVVRSNRGLAADDGFYITDTATGESRLLVSIAEMVERCDPPLVINSPDQQEVYGFHSKFNPQSTHLMLSVRWYAARGEPTWDMFKIDHSAVHFAWVTYELATGRMHCSTGDDQWCKGGHHATWMPDGKRISMNLNIDGEGMRFVQVNADGSDLRKILDDVPGSGHPTVSPDGRHILTDCYTFSNMAYGDGTLPLRWVDLETGGEQAIVRIASDTGTADSVMRVDPHPAWDRTGRYVVFNAFVGGTRGVYLADMSGLLG